MGTRLISLCFAACLRCGVWPWSVDSGVASVYVEVPEATRGGSEAPWLGNGSSGSPSALLEQDSEGTVWGRDSAVTEAIFPRLAEELPCRSEAPPSDAETTGPSHRIVGMLVYVSWAILGSQWIGVRTARACLAGLAIGLAILVGLRASVPVSSQALGAVAVVLDLGFCLLRWMATWGSSGALRSFGGTRRKLVLYGPAVDRYPDTALLRQLKSGTE